MKQTGLGAAPIDADFGPNDYRLWVPRHAQDGIAGDTVFQRRMPPCGRDGLWAHWKADEHLRDFHSDLKVRLDGSVVTTHLAVYPTAPVAHRWMHQFTNDSFACSRVLTPEGNKPVQRTDLFELEPYPAGRSSFEFDEVVGMGQEYRLFNGARGSVGRVAFRASNAVLLVGRWDPTDSNPDLGASTYSMLERVSRPTLGQIVRHYG